MPDYSVAIDCDVLEHHYLGLGPPGDSTDKILAWIAAGTIAGFIGTSCISHLTKALEKWSNLQASLGRDTLSADTIDFIITRTQDLLLVSPLRNCNDIATIHKHHKTNWIITLNSELIGKMNGQALPPNDFVETVTALLAPPTTS